MKINKVAGGNQAVYIGPAPSSGYHFMTYYGELNDNHEDTTNHNLIQGLSKIQSFGYNFASERTDILQVGLKTTVDRDFVNTPTVSVNFSYLQAGLRNEARMGLMVNYPQLVGQDVGEPVFNSNFEVNILSGFESRNVSQPSVDPYWPPAYRDKRSLYLAESRNNDGIFNGILEYDSGIQYNNFSDERSPSYHVTSFGNCYLNSMSWRGSVGALADASVSYIAENIKFDISGSGVSIPAVVPKTRELVEGKHFVIPQTLPNEGVSSLKPGDITLNFSSFDEDKISDIGVDFNNLQIQDYQINMNLEREALDRLAYKLPEDRAINYPVFVDFEFNIIVNENETGSIIEAVNKNGFYDISIELKG